MSDKIPAMGMGARMFAPLRTTLLLAGIVVSAFAADENKVFTPGASRTEAPGNTAGASLSSMSLILGVGLAAAGGWMVWRNRRGVPVGRDRRERRGDSATPSIRLPRRARQDRKSVV